MFFVVPLARLFHCISQFVGDAAFSGQRTASPIVLLLAGLREFFGKGACGLRPLIRCH